MSSPSHEEKIAALERELRELERSLPQHSLKPSQLIRMEEIEEELARLRLSPPCCGASPGERPARRD